MTRLGLLQERGFPVLLYLTLVVTLIWLQPQRKYLKVPSRSWSAPSRAAHAPRLLAATLAATTPPAAALAATLAATTPRATMKKMRTRTLAATLAAAAAAMSPRTPRLPPRPLPRLPPSPLLL